MEIIKAILTRRSIRRFKPDPVPRKVLEEILAACQWAESPMNTQPAEFAVIGGEVIKELKDRMTEKFAADAPEEPEFAALVLPELCSQRAADYRNSTDAFQFPAGTENLEEKRRLYGLTNVQFRTAPDAIIVYADKTIGLHPYVLIGVGAMAQTICLAALAHGLGTCIMGVRYATMIKEILGIPQSKVILHLIGIGYPDSEARINNFTRTRISLGSCVSWHGF
jgi:nitroreductase